MEKKAITAIRALVADTVQKANSGHPGMAIGSAPLQVQTFTLLGSPGCETVDLAASKDSLFLKL